MARRTVEVPDTFELAGEWWEQLEQADRMLSSIEISIADAKREVVGGPSPRPATPILDELFELPPRTTDDAFADLCCLVEQRFVLRALRDQIRRDNWMDPRQ